MSISLRPRRYVAALLAIALIGALPIPAAGANDVLPRTVDAGPAAAAPAPWWVDWLKAFDHDRDRIDDEAEAIASRKPNGLVPVIVTFLNRDYDLTALVKAVDATAVAPFRTQPMVDLDVPASKLGNLSTFPGVVAVQYDRPLVPFLGVSTPATQASNGVGANTHYNGSTAEDLGYKGEDMVVAVLDTGVQEQHAAFTGKYIAGTDVSPQIPVGTACVGAVDDQGHGTHVASTAIGNMTSSNLAGTAKNGKVVEVRIAVGGATAQLGPATIGSTNRGFEFVKLFNDRLAAGNPLCGPNDDHIDVATLSFGSLGRGGPNAGTTEPFIDALVNSGVAVTVAVGNCGPSPSSTCTFGDTDNGIASPGNAAGAIGVASFNDGATVDRANDVISGFSSRGPNAGGTGDTTAGGATSPADLQDRYRKPEIAAPGEAIQAAGPAPFLLSTSSGTSMATPHVAGIAALLLEAGEDAKAETGGVNLMASTGNGYDAGGAYVPRQYPVRDAIVNSGEYKEAGALAKWTGPNSTGLKWNNAWGYGQVDAFGALCWAWANVLAPAGATPPSAVSSKCTLTDPDPTSTPTVSATPTPTPTPTESAGPSSTYYLHSLTGDNTLDQAVDGASFDAVASEFGPGEHSLARDLPGFQNTGLIEVVDPTWRGTLDVPATSLSVDFWGEQIPDQDLGSVNYLVRVLPEGATSYYELLPAISRPEAEIGFVNIKHTFTSMRIGTGVEQPLQLPAGPLTFTIRGTYAVDDASTTLAFDSTEYHSSFTINPGGSDPDPDPTVTPTASPSPDPTPVPTATAFYLHSGSGVGQADRADGSSTFNAVEPTATDASMFVDVPQLSNGAPQAIYDPYWTGRVATRFSSVTLNFWQEQPLSEGSVRYSPSIWVGSTQYTLGAFTGTPDADGLVSQTFTQYVKADGTKADLSAIDPRGSDVTLTLPAASPSTNGGTTAASSIVYDSVDRPSGFTIEPYDGPELPPAGGECDGTPTQAKSAGQRGTYLAPNDPCLGKQWGMGIIGAPDAWAHGATGHQVRVAVIDSGLDLGHPDFDCPDKIDRDKAAAVIDGKVIRGTKAQDIDGHGTHVAGIVGACTNNGTGVVGVAPDATLIPYRVFTTADEGAGDLNDIAVAIEQATDDGAHVINMSLGIGIGALPIVGGFIGYTPDLFPEIDQAIEYAQSKGVVVVIAAGNSFVLPLCEYPAIAEDALCVGSTDRNDLKSSFGTFPNKPPSGSPSADRPMGPSISAPGGIGNVVGLPQLCPESVFSTYMRSAESGCSTSGYDAIDGTSMASPHVAGAAALLYDRLDGARSPENRQLIVDRLLDTSKDLGTPGYDPLYGYGRLDASAAVDGFGSTGPATIPTSLTFIDPPTDGQFSDEVSVSARLADVETERPIGDQDVTFQLVGDTETVTWTARTGADGVATASHTLSSQPGRYQLLASFTPGQDSAYEASTDVEDFTIEREDSTTTLVVGEATGNGKEKARALTATVADQDSAAGIAGIAVSFFCDGSLVATVQADADGTARFDAPKNCANGSHEYRAVFEGDDRFIGSSDTRSS